MFKTQPWQKSNKMHATMPFVSIIILALINVSSWKAFFLIQSNLFFHSHTSGSLLPYSSDCSYRKALFLCL